MAKMVQVKKKIALLHRHPEHRIKETNAAFPYLKAKGLDVLTFRDFPRTGNNWKFIKSILWIFYAPLLVWGRGYDVIYCDDSYPFYPALVKFFCPEAKVIIRLGDLHLMYYYSGLTYKILHFFEKIAWRMVDGIIAISRQMQFYISKTKACCLVLDPVDPKDFPMSGAKNEGTVMFHGLLTKNKDVDILLEAARRLPDVKFVIIGDGPDKKRLMRESPKNVYFKGWVPFKSIHRHIETCSVGVALRSDNPGNEYVVTSPFLQYGIMGKPCLVTRRKVFGTYYWQFKDVKDLVTALTVLINNPELAKQEGQILREYILKNHDAEKVAEGIWKILN